MRLNFLFFFTLILVGPCYALDVVPISRGKFVPLYGVAANGSPLLVESFYLDRLPVINNEYAVFIASKPSWAVGKALPLLADKNYLTHWSGASTKSGGRQPVVNISWYAANDYCVWKGGRLPTTLEWEYVAAASETKADASKDSDFIQRILTWYSKPTNASMLAEVGKSTPNYWGVFDLHGLVWEWTSDFNSIFAAGDNRSDGELLKNLFCGNSATGSTDRNNYAAFMRYALRNSLKASYTTDSLGFRCAYDQLPNDGGDKNG